MANNEEEAEDEIISSVRVPVGNVGRVLGAKRSMANKLQHEFKCEIWLDDDIVDGNKKTFYVSAKERGDADGAIEAIKRIAYKNEIMEVESLVAKFGESFIISGTQNSQIQPLLNKPAVQQPISPHKPEKRLTVPLLRDMQPTFHHRYNELQVYVSREFALALQNEHCDSVNKIHEQYKWARVATVVSRSNATITVKTSRRGDHSGTLRVIHELFSLIFENQLGRSFLQDLKNALNVQIHQFRDTDDPLPLWCSSGICTGDTEVAWGSSECNNKHKLQNGFEKALGPGNGYIFCRYCPPKDNRIQLVDGKYSNRHPLLLNKCPKTQHFDSSSNIRTYHAAWVSCHGVLLH